MGSWGITMRESDYGLDLLGTIVRTELKAADFSSFRVADALEVIKADIMEEIRQAMTALHQHRLASITRSTHRGWRQSRNVLLSFEPTAIWWITAIT